MKMEAITTTTSSSSSNTSSPAATSLNLRTGGHEEHNISQPLSAAPSASSSPGLSPSGKIWGRNINGTSVLTSAPNNEAELQLYRVLQRASLLAYYDTLLEMGGDDVQQLCDAGEEEFLEIMALVGMATKPLHVRRLQKSLHEWVTNPALFQAPLAPPMNYVSFAETSPQMSSYSPEPSTSKKCPNLPIFTPTPLIPAAIIHPAQPFTPQTTPTTHHHPHPAHHQHLHHPQVLPPSHQVTSSSPQLTPILTEAQVRKIVQGIEKVGAEKIATEIAKHEPRTQNIKKRTTRELEGVMAMSEQDPRRMDEIRKHSAIYGRYDCKRRPDKPLTLHEVCVNEAAAQLCKLIPALLTRRDHLFTLARQIVKDCGFGQSASVAKFSMTTSVITSPTNTPSQRQASDDHETVVVKRQRLSSTETTDSGKENVEDTRFNFFAMYQRFARPQEDGSKSSVTNKSDFEDNDNDDSRFSFSNSSTSPLPQLNGSDADHNHENGKDDSNSSTTLHVLSAAGGHIIAVANPALALSPALNDTLPLKRETNATP